MKKLLHILSITLFLTANLNGVSGSMLSRFPQVRQSLTMRKALVATLLGGGWYLYNSFNYTDQQMREWIHNKGKNWLKSQGYQEDAKASLPVHGKLKQEQLGRLTFSDKVNPARTFNFYTFSKAPTVDAQYSDTKPLELTHKDFLAPGSNCDVVIARASWKFTHTIHPKAVRVLGISFDQHLGSFSIDGKIEGYKNSR